MSNGDEYRSTEYWERQDQEAMPGGLPYQGGWPGIAGPANRAKTEVLIQEGPRIFGMLVIVDGPGTGQVFKLNPTEANLLGRDYNCDIVIDEPAVSRQHAKIRLQKGDDGELRYFVQDLATENGIEVNGKEVIKHYLVDGDRIKLGRATLVFKQV